MRRIALPGSPKKESAAAGLGTVTGASAMGVSITVVIGVLPATAGASAAGGAPAVASGALTAAGVATGAAWLATVGAAGAGMGAEAVAAGR